MDDSAVTEDSRELLVMQIEIEPGKVDELVVRGCDSPRTLATKFLEHHGLDQGLTDILVGSINENLGLTPVRKAPTVKTVKSLSPPTIKESPAETTSHIGPRLYQRGMQLKRKLDRLL
jgi:hypothetical protein